MTKLLPCPFCGNNPILYEYSIPPGVIFYQINCDVCKYFFQDTTNKNWIIDTWNTRVTQKESEPLKLEVGKVYENSIGDRWLCVRKNDYTKYFSCVYLDMSSITFELKYEISGEGNGDLPLIKLSPNQSREIIL